MKRSPPKEKCSSMAESEVCAESGGLVGLKVVDPPSIVAAGTVVDNRRENQLSRG